MEFLGAGDWEPKVKVPSLQDTSLIRGLQDRGNYHWRVTAVSGPPESVPMRSA